ncbi:unnamed protein product [Symbiodinium sp. CCMP2592]|nr:unnamed protein product [Symbiodinium sp. CCMP2592]
MSRPLFLACRPEPKTGTLNSVRSVPEQLQASNADGAGFAWSGGRALSKVGCDVWHGVSQMRKPERGRFLRELGHATRSLHAGLRREAETERKADGPLDRGEAEDHEDVKATASFDQGGSAKGSRIKAVDEATSAKASDPVEDAKHADLAAARRLQTLAIDELETAQKAVDTLSEVWLQELRARNTKEVEKAKQELEVAKQELAVAKQEVEKAKEAVKASIQAGRVQVDVSQAAEFFGKLLFDDTEGWPMTDAGYQSSPSCIIDLSRGPFNGALASRCSMAGKQDKSNLLDRDREMQDVVKKVVARAQCLKGCASSDKGFSPALLVAQAPGSGKSHFLAELGEKILRLPDLKGQEQKPIVSAFTYSSAMSSKLNRGTLASNSAVDLALRVLYGAAHHMTRAGLRCTSWMAFLNAIHADAASNNMLACLDDLDFAVEILHHWYGTRPLVILADEVGRSDEGLVRNRLCELMDAWAGQVYVAMSALSNYQRAVDIFSKSKRKVEFQILPVLGVDTFNKFRSVLTDLDKGSRSNTKKAILSYRIGLAWGATAGYARAVEYLTALLRDSNGLSSGSVTGSIAKIGEMGTNLPPGFRAPELEAVLQSWDSVDCPFRQLGQVTSIMSLQEGIYEGRVLVEARHFSEQQLLFMPTVAAWHAAIWFETSFHLVQSFPRSHKLWHMMGKAYRTKREAIESSNETIMNQAAAYFTEVTGAVGVMLAIVKLHEKLPQALKTDCQSFLDIGFNDSLAQDPDLATANKNEARQNIERFLQKARDLGTDHCGSAPFLFIMAPANCMALDFVIFRRESGSLVAAVQVKSNTLLKEKDFTEQAKNLGKAAKTVRQFNMDFLAVLGSNFPTGVIDDLHSLQQDDLVALIPPFLRHLSGLAAGVPGPDSAE